MRVIYESPDKVFRIIEHVDSVASLEDLKGDTFNREVNPDIPEERMAREERVFEELVEREGVFGYVLEKWNPRPGVGYQPVDSCWGFVGHYSESDPTFKHEIVEEMLETIRTQANQAA